MQVATEVTVQVDMHDVATQILHSSYVYIYIYIYYLVPRVPYSNTRPPLFGTRVPSPRSQSAQASPSFAEGRFFFHFTC